MLSTIRTVLPRRITPRIASSRYITKAIGATRQTEKSVTSFIIPNATSSYRTFATTRLLRQEAAVQQDAGSQAAAATPNSHPTTFAGLADIGINEKIVHTITNNMKYTDMTEVQAKTIPVSLSGADLIARAKTGTGKTLAFLIPSISKLLNSGLKKPEYPQNINGHKSFADPRILVISPTRELAEQIAKDAFLLTRGTNLHVSCMVGGTGKSYSIRDYHQRGANILVATPGRLADVLSDPSSGVDMKNLETLIFDEADSLMSMGFEKEVREIRSYLPEEKQTLMFSATMPDKVRQLISENMRRGFKFVNTIDPNEAETHTKVPQHVIMCEGMENLHPTLFELLHRENDKAKKANESFKAMVFFPTARGAELAAMMFRRVRLPGSEGHPLFPLDLIQIHSRLTQSRRTEAANAFRRGENAILFSSDVTARGMDFPNVTHVIQVGTPSNREQYIHRIGRTARGKNIESGRSVGYLILSDLDARIALRELRGINLIHDQNDDLVSKSAKLSDIDTLHPRASEFARAIVEACGRLDSSLLKQAWLSSIGAYNTQGIDGMEIVRSLFNVSKYNFGHEFPPPVSREWALKMGLPFDSAVRKGWLAPMEASEVRGRNAGVAYSARTGRMDGAFQDSDGGRQGSYGGGSRGGSSFGGRGGYGDRSGGDRSSGGYGNRQGGGSNRQGGGGYGGRRDGGSGYGDRREGGSFGGRRDGGDFGGRREGGRGGYGDRSGGGFRPRGDRQPRETY
ncbi:hypothetical protein TWF569_001727 [Orbilia oligospora]|uniref:ATP-dependent RNA helicase n=1 Tax=Orbilia oligospora TaxID=2813651 RepID=A0A7C8JZ29_ORBOL|nr:hypothetical protein TWF103_000792 [Orbilia oligospora]KAF3100325.1 hypothetical protein TWF102_005211 [Orbilia oligospora]KAF3111784.1 hypothetical protein TWF706_011514 [Orbilia oligospora]KAF3123480.1 hypothetical protein TWF569_001727 [Orbilia oligospora]KAF3140127.1 hypothetical protein TWF594_006515 [Orbilia oligospora]